MLIVIPQLLSDGEVKALAGLAETARFSDGRASAGGYLKGAKNNLQMEATQEQQALLQNTMLGALQRCTEFHDFAVPRHIGAFRINRYQIGMTYGSHLDNPLIGDTQTLRSDISMTVFLSDPASYDGGELRLETPFGVEEAKLFPGDAVVYATATMQRRWRRPSARPSPSPSGRGQWARPATLAFAETTVSGWSWPSIWSSFIG